MTNAESWYEVEGAGPDALVRAEDPEEAARAVCERQRQGAVERLEYLDGGSDGSTLARYEWEGGELGGRVTVRWVSSAQRAILDGCDIDAGEIVEAAQYRSSAWTA